ncbi:hypothetical protein SAMN06295909_0118 [Plantibacter sp. VKM Ac-1784]|uniref:Uncharacterized protein n=1 Tax=Plantibacter elymi (nom. nud.) TaxID=199708 RepID=A0ABY1R7I6_9MICO|nr:hypothetical protein [Plantibacter sp. VKM Ac-1784]SMQ58182.1 hypothetical protein SAMN06295909_0118 [Plantibacter sp. VKM Ac-1784]
MTPLPRPEKGGFIARIGRRFGTEQVVVIHEGVRHELEAQVQAHSAFFDITAPVHDGDTMELSDPRSTTGGTRTVYVTTTDVNKAPSNMPSHASHIEAKFTTSPPRPVAPAQHVHGDQYVITGSQSVNIVTRGGTLNQTSTVTSGYEELAQKIQQAIDALSAADDLDDDEREAGREAASTVLEEIVQAEPNQRKVKGALATLRGVLGSAANAGAGALATALVTQLFI